MSLPTNFFIGRGSGGAIEFNDYGITSGNISSLTSIAYTNAITDSQLSRQKSFSSVMLDRDGVAYDPSNARLVTSSAAGGTQGNSPSLYPRYFYPSNNMGWGSVSSASDINDNSYFLEADNQSGAANQGCKIGGSHYVDSTSTKVLSNALQYSQMSESDYDVQTRFYYKDANNNYATNNFFTSISSNTPATRYNRDMDSTAGLTVQVGKDQSGGTSGYSGQPTYSHAKRYDTSGMTSYHETDFLQSDTTQNTHGHSNKGAFLGGRTVGNSTYAYYFVQYNYHSGGGAEGYRLIQYNYTTASAGAIGRQISQHTNKYVNANDGYITTGNQVWPHAFFSDNQSTTQDAGTYGNIHYIDMSGTWNANSTGFPYYEIETTSQKKYISRIGGTTSAPIFIMLENAQLEVRPFDTSTRTFGSAIATQSVYSSDRVNGIWPVPTTNRILVSYYNGVQVFEAA